MAQGTPWRPVPGEHPSSTCFSLKCWELGPNAAPEALAASAHCPSVSPGHRALALSTQPEGDSAIDSLLSPLSLLPPPSLPFPPVGKPGDASLLALSSKLRSWPCEH